MWNPLVTLPPALLPRIATERVRIEVSGPADVRDLERCSPLPPDTTVLWHPGTVGAGADWRASHPAAQSVVVLDAAAFADWRGLVRAIGSWGGAAVEAGISAADPTALRVLVSSGVPVRLFVDATGPEALARLADATDYYLHEPAVRVHVEPAARLLSLGRTPRKTPGTTLWDLALERIDRHLWVDRDGAVSLSARWARTHGVFGRLGPDGAAPSREAFAASPAWRAAEDFVTDLFRTRAPCAFCPAFRTCEGWLLGLDPATDCAPWVAWFRDLEGEAVRIEEARRSAGRPLAAEAPAGADPADF